jgi:hypothetical protein
MIPFPRVRRTRERKIQSQLQHQNDTITPEKIREVRSAPHCGV